MLKKCKIQVKDFQLIVTLRQTSTAEEIWKALPIKSTVNTWGDEVYFFTSVDALGSLSPPKIHFHILIIWSPYDCYIV